MTGILPRGNIVYVKTFQAVASAVESGLCKFGVLPIENSSNGSVRAVYELLQDHKLSVVRSTRLCIRHELLGLPGAEALRHHGDLLPRAGHRPVQPLPDEPQRRTGGALRQYRRRRPDGGGAGRQAMWPPFPPTPAPLCTAWSCLNDDIQDSDNNYTRFFCVSKDPVIYAGANRISLIIACANKPGALYEILSKLAALGINMTKLESCPVTGRNFEFIFFLELEASVHEPGVLSMLEELERSCESFQFLGSYAEV